MTALSRQEAKIFAINALASQVTAFRTTESDTPSTTKIPNAIQNEKYLQGWLNPDNTGNVLPFAEDMNAVFLTLSYNTAYLYEKGIPEYSASQTYYENSFCQYNGKLYRCKVDGTINYVPTNTSKWDEVPTTSYSVTNIGTGAKIYNEAVTGPNFQLKTLVAGSNITLTEDDDSITIAAAGGGGTTITATSPLNLTNNVLSIAAATGSQSGYLSAADWTSFNSKLSSTIFSANNTWSGTNTFSTILPSSGATLGNASNYWTIYGASLISDEGIDLSYQDARFINSSFTLGYNGTNLGFFPRMSSTDGYDSYLGDTVYRWDYGYFGTLNTTYLTATDLSLGSNALYITGYTGSLTATLAYLEYNSNASGLAFYPGADDRGTIGLSSSKWKEIYGTNIITNKITSSNNSSIYFELQDTGASKDWILFNQNSYIKAYSGGNLEFYLEDISDTTKNGGFVCSYNEILPIANNAVSLGGSGKVWSHGWFSEVNSNTINCGASNLSIEASGHLYILPNPGSGSNAYLGNSANSWNTLYTRNLNFTTGNVSLSGASNNDLSLIPNPASGHSSYLGNSSYPWTASYITTVNSNKVGLRTGTTERASLYVEDNGKCILKRSSDYGTSKYIQVINRTSGVQLADGGSSWTSMSDIRLKENIKPITTALNDILSLNPVKYSLKEHNLSYADRAGFIAQEVQQYIPEVVIGTETDDDYLGINYTEMIPFIVKAIQELSTEIEDLKVQLEELRK